MNEQYNKLIEIKKEGHILEIVNELGDWRFCVKWDGCVHIENWSNGDTYKTPNSQERDYMHICDLHEYINMLQDIERKAKAHYGEQWPEL